MERSTTERGFPVITFTDFYGNPCSIQMSSIFYPPCLWIGRGNERMHLSFDQIQEIHKLLGEYLETGKI
jgi:hypothetical protein